MPTPTPAPTPRPTPTPAPGSAPSPIPAPPLVQWRARDAGSAPFLYLPADVFRRAPRQAQPGAPPLDEELLASLPAVEPRALRDRDLDRTIKGQLWRDRGLRSGVPRERSVLALHNGSRRLAQRIVLTPLDEDDQPAGEEFVHLLGPGESDSFMVPSGRWGSRRELWTLGEEEPVLVERWEPQVFLPGFLLEASLDTREERDIAVELNRARRGR